MSGNTTAITVKNGQVISLSRVEKAGESCFSTMLIQRREGGGFSLKAFSTGYEPIEKSGDELELLLSMLDPCDPTRADILLLFQTDCPTEQMIKELFPNCTIKFS